MSVSEIEEQRKRQAKVRNKHVEAGRRQVAAWIDEEQLVKIDQQKKALGLRSRGEVIEFMIMSFEKLSMKIEQSGIAQGDQPVSR